MLGAWLVTAAFAGGTVDVESLSVDGLELRELSCTLDKAPLLGPLVVGAALAAQKDALHACAPEGHAFRVEWTWSDRTSASVTAASAKGADDCVKAALEKMPPALTGRCTAVVLTGPTEAAEKARAGLAGVPKP